ncbi:NAD(P)-binding protein [Aureobasidium pullulans]|uniref:NAD(P)-binding protein n=1 Tax=Aureobasidium pullulans TaxID=5580 RepID=A0A4S9RJV7_AURPU|nr:NAD(P)-binding protein [Aureobasidium pullulans]THY98296.1 NAD(P)-binding protein [Aureobasidium pullulans]
MPVTVLSDHDVQRVLHSLTSQDIDDIQQSLADALHQYSTAGEEDGCCSAYQPQRIHMKRTDGATSLFMPASSSSGMGVKVITLDSVNKPETTPDLKRLSIGSTKSTQSSTSDPKSRPASMSGTTLASSISEESKPASVPRGSLTLFDNQGNPSALVNAEELTAFRTALTSCMLLKRRHKVHDLTVFGAGKQAYWHIRLALLLRGSEIHHVNVINRSFDRAREMLMKLYNPFPDDPDYENPLGHKYGNKTKTSILTTGHTEYTRLLKEYVRSANVIFCTTPSTQPLFPPNYLLNPEGRKKGRYIALIGSYKPHMIELHPDIIKSAVAPHHEHRHFHKHQKEGGAIIVDSIEACLQEAGELIQANVQPHQVVEIGELVLLKREAEKAAAEAAKKGDTDNKGDGIQVSDDSGLKEWLCKGNVIAKIVGLGLMDVVVGNEVVRIARERGIGTHIADF